MKTTQMKFTVEKTRITNVQTNWLIPYCKFNDIEEFNSHYEQMMLDHKKKFTKVQHAILNVIRKYAAKVPGVANASYKKYNESIQAVLGHTVHSDTIKNTIDKAERMGLLLKVPGKRLDGSYTANVIVFNRCEDIKAYEIAYAENLENEIARKLEEEYQQMAPAIQYAHNARKWAEEKAQKEAEKRAESERKERETRIASFENNKTDYQKLKDLLTNVVTEKESYKAFGAWKAQTFRMVHKPDFKLALEAAKVLRMEVKRRHEKNKQPLGNPIGYYNKVLSNLIDKSIEEGIRNSLEEEGIL